MSELTMQHIGSAAIGYGRLGMLLHQELENLGVDVYDRFDDPRGGAAYTPAQEALNEGRRQKRTNVVCWISVPGHARGWYRGQHAGVFTMWEATRVPPSFLEGLHNFDTMLVPSTQNLELFAPYHHNIRKVPLGVDPDIWTYVERTPPTREFRFLIGGSGVRKGTDLAYKAFRKVFRTWPKDGPVPKLIMKSPKPEDFYGDNIERIGGRISAEEEVSLYASSHVYLQPSRGEGWGLQPLQAIAQGMPTVLTDAHGHADFAHLGYGLDTSMSKAAYFVYGDAGDWWEPDFDQLCEYMAYLYCEYDEACELAKKNSEIARREFTWENTARIFIDAFDGALDLPFSGTEEWVPLDIKRYKVITDRDWVADVAGVRYHFVKGQTYWCPADVKRLLWEGGYLDPRCCVGPETGLGEHQLEHLERYCASHSFCTACGQPLNDKPTLADEIYQRLERDRGAR